MRLVALLVITAATTLVLQGTSCADDKPDFTGTWTVETDLSPIPHWRPNPMLKGIGSGWGTHFSITQTTDLLEVERPVFGPYDMMPQPRFRYPLTGARRTNTVVMGRGAYLEDSTTRWEGDTLVITTLHSFRHPDSGEEVKYEVKHVLSLAQPETDSGSPSLVIETTRAGVLGGTRSTTRTVFHKEQPPAASGNGQ